MMVLKMSLSMVLSFVELFSMLIRFNATALLERLRNKRLIFVGDSLNRGQWVSMVCLVDSAVPPTLKSMHTNGSLSTFKATVSNNICCKKKKKGLYKCIIHLVLWIWDIWACQSNHSGIRLEFHSWANRES